MILMWALSSCASYPPDGTEMVRNGIAVLGVTVRPELDISVNRSHLALEFSDLLRETGRFATLPAQQISNVIGAKNYGELMGRFAANGQLHEEDIQLLAAAGLPVRLALVARVETDVIAAGKPKIQRVSNNAGITLHDRELVVQSTYRETSLSATLIDLDSGKRRWTHTYSVTPVSETAHTRYMGSSFSGSLAAALANVMANGIRRVPASPAAPSLKLSLRSLMREIARNLPASSYR